MSSLQGKVAVITGGSSGIGKAVAAELLKKGGKAVINGRRVHALAEAANEIDPTGANIRFVEGDIAERTTARRLIKEAAESFGRVDLLVNNAGIFIAKSFTDYTEDDYSTVIATNLSGFFHITQIAMEQMLKQGSGHIVNITTSLADHPIAGVPSVLASLTKGGLNAATKSLAIEYAAQGIRVNAVSPGIIKTPMHAAETHDFLASLHPVGRMGEVSDIAQAVLYLESAGFVTGEILHVDGGQYAGH